MEATLKYIILAMNAQLMLGDFLGECHLPFQKGVDTFVIGTHPLEHGSQEALSTEPRNLGSRAAIQPFQWKISLMTSSKSFPVLFLASKVLSSILASGDLIIKTQTLL